MNQDSHRSVAGSCSRLRSVRLHASAPPLGAWSDALLRLSGVAMRAKTWAEVALRCSEGELRCFEPHLNVPEARLRLH